MGMYTYKLHLNCWNLDFSSGLAKRAEKLMHLATSSLLIAPFIWIYFSKFCLSTNQIFLALSSWLFCNQNILMSQVLVNGETHKGPQHRRLTSGLSGAHYC